MTRRTALLIATASATAAAAGEAALPRLAARRLERALGGRGRARVQARPALKLLLGRADRVELALDEVGATAVAGRLGALPRVRELDARAGRVVLGPLAGHDARLRRRDGDVEAALTVPGAALRAFGLSLEPVDADARGLVLEGRAAMFTARARLAARDGALVLAPEGPLAGLPAIPLMADPALRVQRVAAARVPAGWRVTLWATASPPPAGAPARLPARRSGGAPGRGSPDRAG